MARRCGRIVVVFALLVNFWGLPTMADWTYPSVGENVAAGDIIQCTYIDPERAANGDILMDSVCIFSLYDNNGDFYDFIPTDRDVDVVAQRVTFLNSQTNPSYYPTEVGGNETWAIVFTDAWDPGTGLIYEIEHSRPIVINGD